MRVTLFYRRETLWLTTGPALAPMLSLASLGPASLPAAASAGDVKRASMFSARANSASSSSSWAASCASDSCLFSSSYLHALMHNLLKFHDPKYMLYTHATYMVYKAVHA
jgi:hypothetical protein